MTTPAAPIAEKVVIASLSSCSSACWTRLSIDKRQRRAARSRVREIGIERPLHAGNAVAVDVGVAEDMRGKARLRIEPVGLALDRQAGLAQRVDRFDQAR